MTTTTASTTAAARPTATSATGRSIWKPGVVAGLAAAALTTSIVVAARGLDVPVAVSGVRIPLIGFGQFSFVGALFGIGLAMLCAWRARHPRTTFARATLVLTVVSIVPDLLIDATVGTKLVLALTHVAAATAIVPVLGRRLAD